MYITTIMNNYSNMRYRRYKYWLALTIIMAAVCGALAADDTLAVSVNAEPTPMPDSALVLEPVRRDIQYSGAAFSAFIPGGGQFYHGRYVLGSVFLVSEAATFIFLGSSWGSYKSRLADMDRLREAAVFAGSFSAWANRYEYEARQAKYNTYNALAWAVGIHAFSFMNAIELDGFKPSGAEKNPTKAGLLAAVPFLGLGQLYNERPSKAGMIMMAQTSLAVTAIGYHHLMTLSSGRYNEMRDSTSAQYDYSTEHLGYWKTRYDRAFSQRNTFLWITLFTYLYSIFDAVVDAHLSDYEEKIRITPDLDIGTNGLRPGLRLDMKF